MKRTKFWILGMVLLLIYSCSDELESVDRSFNDTGVTEAQSYFEANATDLAPLTFPIPSSLGRSANTTIVPELIPEWDKAIETENEDYRIKEIPIRSQSGITCVERVIKDAEFHRENRIRCQRRLIIAYPKEGKEKPDMFLATLVPDKESARNTENAFTGRIFYSELNGKFRKAVSYKNGKEDKKLLIGEAYGFAIQTEEDIPLGYSKLTFQEENSASLSATYSSSESGGGGISGGGGGGGGGGVGGGGTGGGGTGGIGGGTGTGGGSGDNSDTYYRELGEEGIKQLRTNLANGNVQMACIRLKSTGYSAASETASQDRHADYDVANGFSIGINTASILTSWVGFMNQADVLQYSVAFGKIMGGMGVFASTVQTVIAFYRDDIPNPDFLDIAANVLSLASWVCCWFPPLMPFGVVAGIAGSMIGIIKTMGYYTQAQLIRIYSDDGNEVFIYLSPTMNMVA